MKKWQVTVYATVNKYARIYVEAATADEAQHIAEHQIYEEEPPEGIDWRGHETDCEFDVDEDEDEDEDEDTE